MKNVFTHELKLTSYYYSGLCVCVTKNQWQLSHKLLLLNNVEAHVIKIIV